MASVIFAGLRKHARPRHLYASGEYKYFLENRKWFVKYGVFESFYEADDDFEVIRANILLEGLKNKMAIEEALSGLASESLLEYKTIKHHFVRERMNAKHLDLPYFQDGDLAIYIPFFPRALNIIYSAEPDKLLDFPYDQLKADFSTSTLDPFEMYGDALFGSQFTKLVKVMSGPTSSAFYHYDFQMIYVINRQGRLDVRIPLFDRHLRNPDASHVLERIVPVMAAYYANDKRTFLFELRKKRLISSTVYRKLAKLAHLVPQAGESA